VIADIDGKVEFDQQEGVRILRIVNTEVFSDDYAIPKRFAIQVENEQSVKEGDVLAQFGEKTIVATNPGRVFMEVPAISIQARGGKMVEHPIPTSYHLLVEDGQKVAKGEPLAQHGPRQIVAEAAGTVSVRSQTEMHIRREQRDEKEYEIPTAARLRVDAGAMVQAGQQLTEGSINPNRLLRILGREAAQLYLLTEIQKV